MASARDIRRRITSVQSTAQITKAMQMVSASKMQRAQDRALKAIPYAQGIYEIVNKIGKVVDYDSIYLQKAAKVKNIAILVVGTSRGFVGGQITSLAVKTHKLKLELEQKYPGVQISGISIHKTAQKVLQTAQIKNDYHFADFIEAPTTTDLSTIFSLLINSFAEHKYDQIYLIYSHFVNTVVQQAVSKMILPLNLAQIIQEAEQATDKSATKQTIFEPDTATVLDFLLPEYFQTQIFTAVLEAMASEHSARMVAMKNATDNAKELQKGLTLQYNRTRQSAITQQIIEVINGSAN